MGKTFFIGDTHFGHKNVIKYCHRPFATVAEMDEALIKNWNKVVTNNDKVIMVGDFAFAPVSRIVEIGLQLNGRKTLVMGNHDNKSIGAYLQAGFEVVSPYSIVLDEFFIVSHYPQFVENDRVFANIYAHVHDMETYKDYTARTFCVSAERINYTPIDFEEIKRKMGELDDE